MPARNNAMTYPQSAHPAAIAIDATAHLESDLNQSLARKSRPTLLNSLLRPVSCEPEALLSNQRQTIAVAMNEIAIGKRNTPRKKPSPRMPRSSSSASTNPATMVPMTNTSVNTITFWRSSVNRVSSGRRL